MIDFVSKRYWYFLLSTIIIVPGIIFLALFGLRLGSDFKGGTNITLSFSPSVDESQVRQSLTDLGYGDAVIQTTGSGTYILRLPEISTEEKDTLINGLTTELSSDVTVLDYSNISAIVASETARYAVIAVIVAAVAILIYITWAFRKVPNPFRWGVCAVIALVHDIILVLGIFAILGKLAGVEIDAIFITGMLTVAGYSVHDTIVVFDRIRENLVKSTNRNFEEVVNYSISQTIARSLNTSLTVFIVLLALFLLGGATIHYFTLVLLIGVATGTYSSICNASQLLVVWENHEWGRFIGIKKSTPVKA
jgi:preprotein translocase subunit SecF